MPEAIAYEVRFIPADPNVTAEECMPIYCYDTRGKARAAINNDAVNVARHYERTTKGRDKDTAHAYHVVAVTAMMPSYTSDTFPVVVHGDDPYHIGAYIITELREGSAATCSHCDREGNVVWIGGGGNVIAVCADCATDEGDTHYHA